MKPISEMLAEGRRELRERRGDADRLARLHRVRLDLIEEIEGAGSVDGRAVPLEESRARRLRETLRVVEGSIALEQRQLARDAAGRGEEMATVFFLIH